MGSKGTTCTVGALAFSPAAARKAFTSARLMSTWPVTAMDTLAPGSEVELINGPMS